MNQAILLIFIGSIICTGYIFHNSYAESEFLVEMTKGSYNLGCELDNSCFLPHIIRIDVGNTVTWINNDDAIHVAVSENTKLTEYFDSGFLKTNESFSHTFNTEGNYGYFCTLHPWMQGHVTVGDVEFIEIQNDFDFNSKPIVLDQDFKIEEFVSGLIAPINMEFIENDLLVIEKNSGMVKHVKNGKLLDAPVLDLAVSNYGEHGLLGITSVKNNVYLFFTESFHDGGHVIESKVYKYSWNGDKLVKPVHINSFPGYATQYVGGEMVSDLKGTVYVVTGDSHKMGLLQNHLKHESYRHFSDIDPNNQKNHLTIIDSLNELPSCVKVSFFHRTTNPFSWQSEQPEFTNNPYEMNVLNIITNLNSCLNQFLYENFSDGNWKYTSSIIDVHSKDNPRAIGIRNSFGLAIDPVTGHLWDTENGPDVFDEINLVSEKFNSGWGKIQGPSNGETLPSLPGFEDYMYSEPEFSWELPIGITSIEFHESEIFEKYKNFVFVADSNSGNIYKLRLDDTRTKIDLQSSELKDNVLNIINDEKNNSKIESSEEILFAKNLGVVTDMKFGPDGALYVISIVEGKIYKISK